jgi:hypothetical protein
MSKPGVCPGVKDKNNCGKIKTNDLRTCSKFIYYVIRFVPYLQKLYLKFMKAKMLPAINW